MPDSEHADYAATAAQEYWHARARDFFSDYADCLDQTRFDEADCRYEIRSRENEDLGLPAAIMYCDTHGMIIDRVTMLRKALTYRHMIQRRFISNVRVLVHGAGQCTVRANFQLMQTDNDGVTSLFGVGQYRATLVRADTRIEAAELIVVLDTFGVDNLLAVPI